MKKIILILLIGSSFLFSQYVEDALRPFYGFSSGNPLSVAIGQATVAAGQVLPAIGNNPANPGTQRFRSLSLGYCNGNFEGSSSSMSQDGLSNLQFIFPIPVYQGSLVATAGYNREHDYALMEKEGSNSWREEGNLHSYYMALSMEYMKNLYIGTNFKLLRGTNEYLYTVEDTSGIIKPEYKGYQMSIGILQRMNPYMNIGFSVDFLSHINVEETWDETVISEPDSGFSGTWEYEMNQSPVFRGGAAFFLKWVNLFYEAEVRNWSNLTFQSDLENLDNDLSLDPTLNQKIETELSPVLNHHFGAALHLPFLPLHLYGGYQILPDPYGDTAKHGISFGLSYLLQQQLSINAAYQKQYWEVDGIDQEWNQSTLSLNLHF